MISIVNIDECADCMIFIVYSSLYTRLRLPILLISIFWAFSCHTTVETVEEKPQLVGFGSIRLPNCLPVTWRGYIPTVLEVPIRTLKWDVSVGLCVGLWIGCGIMF